MAFTTSSLPARLSLAPALLLAIGLASCGNSGGDSRSPRVASIPLHTVPGGQTFSVDLKGYVEDDTQTSVYTVLEGGGSFTGSVYSRLFPTLGTWSVKFRVTDFRGNSGDGSLDVRVTSSELAAVRSGTGLGLLDLFTHNFAPIFADDGRTKTLRQALTNGSFVLEVVVAGQKDLWLHDPNVAGTDVFAGNGGQDETFSLAMKSGKVVYQRGALPNRALFVYDPRSKGTQPLTAGGTDERDAVRNADDLVYFESVFNGQADLYMYVASTGLASAISKHAGDEDIVAVLPDGALVFRRQGAGGEWDLYYYHLLKGVLEIGGDLAALPGAESKTYRAAADGSRVVFETTSGSDEDLYVWNPATNTTAAIATGAVDETYVAQTSSGKLVYAVQTGASNADLHWFHPASTTAGTIATSADDEVFRGSLSNGDVVYSRTTLASGVDLYLWDEDAASVGPFPGALVTATDQVFVRVLANDDVVYTTGADLFFFRRATSSSTSVVTAAGTETFAGETAGGDFAIHLTSGGSVFLYLWDSSASAAVAVSTAAGTAAYQGASTAGTILYSFQAPLEVASNLFTYVPATGATTQVTTSAANDTVESVFSAVVD